MTYPEALSGSRSRPGRFYACAETLKDDGLFVVALDAKVAKTPGGAKLGHRSRVLVDAIVEEWAQQGESIDIEAMSLTRLLTTAIDLNGETHAWRSRILNFLNTDTLCYRAVSPGALAHRQAEIWDPILTWFATYAGAELATTSSVIAIDQARDALVAVEELLADELPEVILALRIISEATGSAVLAFARWQSAFPHHVIFDASMVEEEFQIQRWGRDEEAELRSSRVRTEFDAAGRFLDLVAGCPPAKASQN